MGIIIGLWLTINKARAQGAAAEFWPETDIWYKLNHSWRLSAFIPITKYNESKERDLNVYLQADYAWGKTKHLLFRRMMDENKVKVINAWMIRGGIMEGWSLGDNSGSYSEDMIFGEMHSRIPLKGGVLISQRMRLDLRWLGQEPEYSYRLRYRVMIEDELKSGKFSIVPYVNAEPYWDSRYESFSRVRFIGGATLAKGSRFAYELNLTYQYDEHYYTSNLYAVNVIIHIFFETARAKATK